MNNQNPGNEDEHYYGQTQPMDIGRETNTPLYQYHNVVRYLARHKKKNGVEDVQKAWVFILDMLHALASQSEPVAVDAHHLLKRTAAVEALGETEFSICALLCGCIGSHRPSHNGRPNEALLAALQMLLNRIVTEQYGSDVRI